MAVNPIRLALVGVGKIARDQHVPALAANPDFELVGCASRHQSLEGVAHAASLSELLDTGIGIDAVSICTPPQVRYEIASAALRHGLDVMLEKPPGATVNEVTALAELAKAQGATLFTTWHSREAAGVAPAREWLASRRVVRVHIDWREDVRVWHPGQSWIWKAGGLGVFDPGINALSIVTRILPQDVRVTDAELAVPDNCETPIAATVRMLGDAGAEVLAEFDFLHPGPPRWQIDVECEDGHLCLMRGGAVLEIDGGKPESGEDNEYANLYRRFASLVRARESDVDCEPLHLVADAFLCGRRHTVDAFIE